MIRFFSDFQVKQKPGICRVGCTCCQERSTYMMCDVWIVGFVVWEIVSPDHGRVCADGNLTLWSEKNSLIESISNSSPPLKLMHCCLPAVFYYLDTRRTHDSQAHTGRCLLPLQSLMSTKTNKVKHNPFVAAVPIPYTNFSLHFLFYD